jgi:hypothetical protein
MQDEMLAERLQHREQVMQLEQRLTNQRDCNITVFCIFINATVSAEVSVHASFKFTT